MVLQGDRAPVTEVITLGTHITETAWLEVEQVRELLAITAEASCLLSLDDKESERE
jgi:hypothetical protein